jgi:hypothetical protein
MFNFEEMKEISTFLIFFGTFTTVAAIYKISQSGSSSIMEFFLPKRDIDNVLDSSNKSAEEEKNTEFDNFDLDVYK